MKKVYLFNVGSCARLGLDRRRLGDYFSANHFSVVNDPKKADIILILTCGTEKAIEQLSIQTIRRLKRYRAEVIVGGCLPEMNAKAVAALHQGKTISTKTIQKIEDYFPQAAVSFKSVPDSNRPVFPSQAEKLRVYFSFSTFFFKNFLLKVYEEVFPKKRMLPKDLSLIRVSRGCYGKCTYCVIKNAVGPLVSKPVADIVTEARALFDRGVKSVKIVGDDPGSYGLDIGTTYPKLLSEILALDPDISLYLFSLNPHWMLTYQDELLRFSKNIRVMQVPIQSGDRRILKLMNRDIDPEALAILLDKLKKSNPDIKLLTNVIAGFPSETKEEFQNTLEVVKKCAFDKASLFPCYVHKETPAHRMEPKIGAEEIERRMKHGLKELAWAGVFSSRGLLANE